MSVPPESLLPVIESVSMECGIGRGRAEPPFSVVGRVEF
jgi:hypothetical protein